MTDLTTSGHPAPRHVPGIAENSLFVFTMQVVTFVLGVAVSVVVTRALGPSLRGEYFLIQTSCSLLAGLASMGMGATNRYWMSKGKYSVAEVHSTSVLLSLGLGLATIAIYFALRPLLASTIFKGVREGFVILGVALVPFTLYGLFWAGIMSGMSRFSTLSMFTIGTSLLNGILTFLVVLALRGGLPGLLALWAATTLLNTLIMFYLAENRWRIKLGFHPRLLREALAFGFKDHLGTLAYNLFTSADAFIINSLFGLRYTGVYSVAKSLSARVSLLPNSLVQAAIPRIGGASKEESLVLTAKVVRHSLLLSVLACGLLLGIAPWGVPLLYGEDFKTSIIPLALLAPGVVFLTIAVVLSAHTTFQKGRPEIPALFSWIVLGVSVPLCLFLARQQGINGVALAVSASYAILMLLMALPLLAQSRAFFGNSVRVGKEDFLQYRRLLTSRVIRAPAPGPLEHSSSQ